MRSRKKSFFAGKATSITSINDKGEFDILSQHANFISLIKNYVIFNKGMKSEQKFEIGTGVLRNKGNEVEIFLNV